MSLVADLGVGDRDLVAFTGAGGKTTLLLGLGQELTTSGKHVVLGTTTRMGTDQIPSWAEVVSPGAPGAGSTFVVESTDGPKVMGSSPKFFDKIFETSDYVLVEADGARRRQIKAPAPHEPVIPSMTTMVVVVAGLDALGFPVSQVAHRPELVAEIVGLGVDATVTPKMMATLITSPEGGLARVPDGARVVVALTGNGDASELIARISEHPRFKRAFATTTSKQETRQ
jgi:probable selenium-dependent hydroxylase accessory protein YqeC